MTGYVILTAWLGLCLVLVVTSVLVVPLLVANLWADDQHPVVAWTVRAALAFVGLPLVTGLVMATIYGYGHLVGWGW